MISRPGKVSLMLTFRHVLNLNGTCMTGSPSKSLFDANIISDSTYVRSMKEAYYNLSMNRLNTSEFFDQLRAEMATGGQVVVNFVNAHCFNIAQVDMEYRKALNSSTFVLNDGVGIQIGASLLGFRFQENMNGTDLIPKILSTPKLCEKGVYLLGAKPEVVAKASREIQARCPQAPVVGYSDGYFKDTDEILKKINDSGAQVLIVAMGVPMQELWVENNRHALPGVRLIVSGGAIFDFLTGTVARAPVWIQKAGFEWLFRLAQEPRRLFRRYAVGNVVFLFKVLKLRIKMSRPIGDG